MSMFSTVRNSRCVRVTIQRSLVVALVAALSTVGPIPAQAAADGYVRLAHLSPDTPAVDVYLTSQSGAVGKQVFPGVGYGVVSQYLKLPVGGYNVSMRLAGAAESTPAVLTTQVSVASGSAQTVAGVGRHAELGLRVLQDDLSLPKGNKSKVRIVQASVQVPVLGVSLTNGPSIADNVAFATTTEYFVVDPGSWQLQIRPATGGPSTKLSATLGSGNVYSLLIVDAGQGALKTQLFADAQKGRGLPFGGIATGGGGTAGTDKMPVYLIVGASLLLLALATGVVVRLRRRRTTL
jgi:hypothetical protein